MKSLKFYCSASSRVTSGCRTQKRSRSSNTCCACQQQQQTAADRQQQGISRRDLALAAPAMLLLGSAGRAVALEAALEAEAAAAPSPAAAAASSSSSSLPSADLQLFIDNDYQLQVPSNYTYLETPIPRVERGPQPERSPVLGRFEAPNGQPGLITILTRRAQAFKQTLLQVTDISQLGDPVAVAQLVLPRGSTLLATATQQVPQPPKETPLGLVDIPPQNYFLFEFTTTTGLHVAMAAAAKKGSVVICGASTTAQQWPQAGPVLSKAVKSFRLRSQQALAAL
ncbi:hypothetical protein COO60DRAFT_1515422 [Scenedesmus sp. NREL 46B-D3]|nr:hypothetical protein COO60DRAFT_1515422 [Scenedesmus sp. NREL 46B-D3]